jgi:hypothetical protein
MNTTKHPSKLRKAIFAGTVGLIGLTGGLAASSASASASSATTTTTTAATTAASGTGTAGSNVVHPQLGTRVARLTSDQIDCLTAQGITKPQGEPTATQRQELRDAAKTCGIDLPEPGSITKHSDGPGSFTPGTGGRGPTVNGSGSGRNSATGLPTEAQRQAVRDAAKARGLDGRASLPTAPSGSTTAG